MNNDTECLANFSVRLNPRTVDEMRRLARTESVRRNELVQWSQIVREVVQKMATEQRVAA